MGNRTGVGKSERTEAASPRGRASVSRVPLSPAPLIIAPPSMWNAQQAWVLHRHAGGVPPGNGAFLCCDFQSHLADSCTGFRRSVLLISAILIRHLSYPARQRTCAEGIKEQ